MIEVFKTDVTGKRRLKLITRELKNQAPGCCISFDLEDCDRVLRVEGDGFSVESIIRLLRDKGHYCEVLGD